MVPGKERGERSSARMSGFLSDRGLMQYDIKEGAR